VSAPLVVSNRYSLSIGTHGNSCRRRASSSLRRVNAFSSLSSSSRAVSHCSRVPVICFVIALLSFLYVTSPAPVRSLHRAERAPVVSSGRQPPVVFFLQTEPPVPEWRGLFAGRLATRVSRC